MSLEISAETSFALDLTNVAQYGPELITNGEFADDSSWVIGADWAFNTDHMEYDAGGTTAITQSSIEMTSAMENSISYRLEFDISNGGGAADIAFYTVNGSAIYVSRTTYANGHHVIDFTSPAGTTAAGGGIGVYGHAGGGAFHLDNVSLKKQL